MDKQTSGLHDAIMAHNESMKEAMLLLLKGPLDNIPVEVLEAAQKICGAMAALMDAVKAPETE